MNFIGNLCSIIGLLVSIGTLWLASAIKKEVKKTENKALFNSEYDNDITKVKEFNLKLISCEKEDGTKEILHKLETHLTIISKYVPSEFKKQCNKTIKIIRLQYNSNIVYGDNKVQKRRFFIKKTITKENLVGTYHNVTQIIDFLDDYKKKKGVIS